MYNTIFYPIAPFNMPNKDNIYNFTFNFFFTKSSKNDYIHCIILHNIKCMMKSMSKATTSIEVKLHCDMPFDLCFFFKVKEIFFSMKPFFAIPLVVNIWI